MIIYNNKKDFLGIDEESLVSLGFSNLMDLQSEAADFGDLFVKTPGHVHNFKHVHWIDFILCEEDKNACKAIIHAKGKNFTCILDIKTIYLTSSANSKSYIINLVNLRNLSSNETSNISSELQTRDITVETIPTIAETEELIPEPKAVNIILPSPVKKPIISDPYEIIDDLSLESFEPSQEKLDEIGEPDVPTSINNEIEIDFDKPNKAKQEIVEEKNLNFDLNKTASILEMDVATIEDFVNDFISQAKEFKNKLYNAVEEEDLIVLKSLSHQLKGVAANLRIHGCQDILVTINKADDFTSSNADLDIFYNLIAGLAGEELSDTTTKVSELETVKPKTEIKKINEQKINEIEIDEDDYILEIDDMLSTPIKDNPKINSLDHEDDYILEIVDTISTDTNKDDNIPEVNDFDFLGKEQDLNLEANEKKFSIEEKSNEVNKLEELSIVPDLELEVDDPKKLKNKPLKKYNKADIASEIGLDEESFNELFADYTNESQDLVSKIKASIQSNDPANWRHSAIKLKGMSDNMRMDNFTSELETLISTNNEIDAQNALEQLQTSLSQIIPTKD